MTYIWVVHIQGIVIFFFFILFICMVETELTIMSKLQISMP